MKTRSDIPSVDDSYNTLETLRLGVAHEVEDLVKLELTAEQMIASEASLLKAYIAEDAHQAKSFWRELQDEFMLLELSAGEWLLSAADPSSVEWQRAQWWWHHDDALTH